VGSPPKEGIVGLEVEKNDFFMFSVFVAHFLGLCLVVP
jgi:hypothetical protein